MNDTAILLQQILAELRGLRADLARREVDSVANLLRIIHASARDDSFTAAELTRCAAKPENIALRAAFAGEFDDPNSRRIGRFLSSIAGRQIGDFIVEAIGMEHNAVIWRLGVCPTKLPAPIAPQNEAAHPDDFLKESGHAAR